MQACSYASLASAVVGAALMTFGACSGAQTPASSTPASAASASPADPSPVATAATESAPATAASSASAAPPSTEGATPAAGPAGPDRNLNDVRAVIAGNRDGFRACYDRVIKDHPGVEGDFVLHFVVNPDGTIKNAEADQTKSQIHAPEMATCAIGVLKTLKFPSSRKGMETTVNYPFNFRAANKPASTPSHP